MRVKQPCDRTLDLLVNGMEGVFGATGQKTVHSLIFFLSINDVWDREDSYSREFFGPCNDG